MAYDDDLKADLGVLFQVQKMEIDTYRITKFKWFKYAIDVCPSPHKVGVPNSLISTVN